MFRFTLGLLLACLLSSGASAQPGASAPFSFDKRITVPHAGMRAFAVQDLRPDTSRLGGRGRSWWAGAAPDYAIPFASQLQDFGAALLQEGSGSKDSLILQLRSLKVQLHQGIGCVFLDAALLVKRDGVTVSGFDTVIYQESIETELNASLNHLFSGLISLTATRPELVGDPAAITRGGAPSNSNPFRGRGHPRKGVYHSYAEVLSNSPSESLFVLTTVQNAGKSETSLYHADARQRRGSLYRPDEFYAVFNGKSWYKSTPYRPERIVEEGGDAIVYCKQPGLKLEAVAYRRGGSLTPLLSEGEYFYQTKYFTGITSTPGMLVQEVPVLYRSLLSSEDGSIIPVERVRE